MNNGFLGGDQRKGTYKKGVWGRNAVMRLHTFIVLLVSLMGMVFSDPNVSSIPLPFFTVHGTYYQVGYKTGQRFASAIHERLHTKEYEELFQFAQTNPHAQHMNSSMFNATAKYFPDILTETRGQAAGAGVTFAELFFLTTVTEYEHLANYLLPPHKIVCHCTDAFSVAGAVPVWAHNEDGDVDDAGRMYIVSATILSPTNDVLEEFTACSYPGALAGRAYGFNRYGLLLSLNAITALNENFGGPEAVPRAVLGRALYGAVTVENATNILLTHSSVVSFSSNIGKMKQNQPWVDDSLYVNVEVDPRGTKAVTRLRRLPVPARTTTFTTRTTTSRSTLQIALPTVASTAWRGCWRCRSLCRRGTCVRW